PSGSTPASATSPPTRNTEAKEKPSEPPAETVSPEPAPSASPTIAATEPEDPPMRTETPGNSDIKSDTGQSVDQGGRTAAGCDRRRRGWRPRDRCPRGARARRGGRRNRRCRQRLGGARRRQHDGPTGKH